jgi:uncharacterized membrane protein YkoI
MKDRLKKVGIGASLLAAFALGGSAVASALSNESDEQGAATASSTAADSDEAEGSTQERSTEESSTEEGSNEDRSPGQRSDEELLTGETATSVEEAALAEISGGTIERVETDGDGNAAYEAHMVTADGTRVTVFVDEQFNVVSVDESPGHGGRPQDDQEQEGSEGSNV